MLGQEIPVHYGLLWWIKANELQEYGAYLASGTGSQSVMILPDLDLVFVHRASRDYGQGVYGLDAEEILMELIDAKTGDDVPDPEVEPVRWGEN